MATDSSTRGLRSPATRWQSNQITGKLGHFGKIPPIAVLSARLREVPSSVANLNELQGDRLSEVFRLDIAKIRRARNNLRKGGFNVGA